MGHVAGGIQITGGSGTNGSISSGGALVLSGTGELSFAYSGEMTVEQGLAIIEGIAGNPSSESDDDYVEEKDIPEVSKDDLPKNVKESYDKYEENGWKGNYAGQTPGTAAGSRYMNSNGKLPEMDENGSMITYQEFDVNNKVAGQVRDNVRFVVGSDGSIYYTGNHYNSFVKLNIRILTDYSNELFSHIEFIIFWI